MSDTGLHHRHNGAVTRARSGLRWILGLMISGLAVYVAAFGVFDEVYTRGGAVLLAGLTILALLPLAQGREGWRRRVLVAVDLCLAAMLIWAFAQFVSVQDHLFTGFYSLSATDQLAGWLGALVVLELVRRTFGLALSIVAGLLLLYTLFGQNLPWILQTREYYADEVIRVVWYGFDGVFGQTLAIAISVILIFIVFGGVLESVGAGAVLIRIAFALTGKARGGPAYAAVMSSAMFGTISGSVTANVVSTGVFTIPLSKRRGFSGHFAGGVETAASSAGQFTPPVMGAAAFIMADLTGIPYLQVCLMALVPALLYYFGLVSSIMIETSRAGIPAAAPDEVETLTSADLRASLVFIVPILLIIGVIMQGRSPAQAGLLATLASIVLAYLLVPGFRRAPWRLLAGLRVAGENAARIVIAVAAVGIIVGLLSLTGLGTRFAALIGSAATAGLFFGLLVTMVGCIILGMGMPTVPAYLIIILVMGPALADLGADIGLIHLFVIYFAVLSSLTPPVALAAFAAAPIAGANPLRVGLAAMRVAVSGFLIPFAFVYHPALSFVGDFDLFQFLWAVGAVMAAIWLLSGALAGHVVGPLAWWGRVPRAAAALALLHPDPLVAAAGAVAAAYLIAVQDYRALLRRSPAADPIETNH